MIPSILFNLAVLITPTELTIPQTSPDTALPIILRIVFALAGAIALLIIVIAGLRMVVSQGNPEAVNTARNTIIYAAIGLIVCLFGFTIVTFIINRIR